MSVPSGVLSISFLYYLALRLAPDRMIREGVVAEFIRGLLGLAPQLELADSGLLRFAGWILLCLGASRTVVCCRR